MIRVMQVYQCTFLPLDSQTLDVQSGCGSGCSLKIGGLIPSSSIVDVKVSLGKIQLDKSPLYKKTQTCIIGQMRKVESSLSRKVL